MLSNDELTVNKHTNSPVDYNSKKNFTISISSITGHKWEQSVTLCETVDSLKMKIWHRTGLYPYHQGLILDDLSLSELCGKTLLYELGIRNNSLVRLVVITRSGPLALTVPEKLSAVPCSVQTEQNKGDCWDELRFFDEQNLDANRRTLVRMCELRRQMKQSTSTKSISSEKQVLSAPEDTSAKESSAGDTECDDDISCSCSSTTSSAKVFEAAPLSGTKNGDRRVRQNVSKEETPDLCQSESVNNSRDRLLIMMHPRAASPTADLNTHSENGSDFSSGVVVCDLSNEFRRLRVRRKHHGMSNGSASIQRTRARSKPRIPLTALSHHHRGSDVTSSDDEFPHRRITEANFSCSAFRRPSAVSRAQKVLIGYQSQQRCSACAVKLNNFSVAFQCRCGKTLCTRHRPAGMHTCTRVRKLQDVSD